MATNTIVPNGFQLARNYTASTPNYAVYTNNIAYNNTNKISRGDPVKMLSTGFIDVMAVGGTTIHGIFDGCEYFDPVAQIYRFSNFWPGVSGLPSTSTIVARVIIDPFATFIAQVVGGPAVQAAEGMNIDITTGTSGVPNIAGTSTCSLAYSTLATTATLPFRVLRVVRNGISSSYDPNGANNWVEVRMNTSDALQTTGI